MAIGYPTRSLTHFGIVYFAKNILRNTLLEKYASSA